MTCNAAQISPAHAHHTSTSRGDWGPRVQRPSCSGMGTTQRSFVRRHHWRLPPAGALRVCVCVCVRMCGTAPFVQSFLFRRPKPQLDVEVPCIQRSRRPGPCWCACCCLLPGASSVLRTVADIYSRCRPIGLFCACLRLRVALVDLVLVLVLLLLVLASTLFVSCSGQS